LFSCLLWSSTLFSQDLLTLSKALEIAALNSPDLKQYALSLERSQESLKSQEAALKSDFDLSLTPLSYSNQLKYDDTPNGDGWYNVQQSTSSGKLSISQPILLTDATVGLSNYFSWQDANGNQSFYNNLTLSIDQPLFSHNEQKMSLKEVELDVENAELDYALQKLSMELSITSQFYSVYQKQMQLLIYQDQLSNQQKNHTIVEQKVKAGLMELQELYQSEVNVISSETTLESYQVSFQDAKDEFCLLLGTGFDYDFIAVLNVQTDSVVIDQAAAIERSIQVAIELRQREIDLEIAELSLLQTMDNNSFSANLSLQMGLSGQNEYLQDIYSKATNNKGVSISLEVPIWDWGKRKANIRYSEIGLEKQELYLLEDRNDIELTIRQLHRSLVSLYHQIEKAEKNVRNAQLTYDTNLERFRKGKISGMELQLYQTQLSSKKMTQTSAIINYKIELLNMKIQTLYDWEKDEEFLPDDLFTYKKK